MLLFNIQILMPKELKVKGIFAKSPSSKERLMKLVGGAEDWNQITEGRHSIFFEKGSAIQTSLSG
jgi:hypothetical protein